MALIPAAMTLLNVALYRVNVDAGGSGIVQIVCGIGYALCAIGTAWCEAQRVEAGNHRKP